MEVPETTEIQGQKASARDEWFHGLGRLGFGTERLMPTKDVKAYVKRNKNDAADAEAICEAVAPP
jgi:transposase